MCRTDAIADVMDEAYGFAMAIAAPQLFIYKYYGAVQNGELCRSQITYYEVNP